jgi:hypothetical protein
VTAATTARPTATAMIAPTHAPPAPMPTVAKRPRHAAKGASSARAIAADSPVHGGLSGPGF